MTKRKTGLKSFWDRFYYKHILRRRNFHYEIARKPRKVVTSLEKYWKKEARYTHRLKLTALEEYEVWAFELGLVSNWEIQTQGEICLENDKTTINISIETYQEEALKIVLIAAVLIFALVSLLAFGKLIAVICSLIPLILCFLDYCICVDTNRRHKKLIQFLESFVSEENSKMEKEWAIIHSKPKNDEIADADYLMCTPEGEMIEVKSD
jgi:hypothetical protein